MKIRTQVIGVMIGVIVTITFLVFFWFWNRHEQLLEQAAKEQEAQEQAVKQALQQLELDYSPVGEWSTYEQAAVEAQQRQEQVELERSIERSIISLSLEIAMEAIRQKQISSRNYFEDKKEQEKLDKMRKELAQQLLKLKRLNREKAQRQAELEQLQQEQVTVKQQQEARRQAAALDILDQILEKLEFANIAFNTPKTLNLHDTVVIQLVLSLKISTDELIQTLTAPGEKEGTRIRVSNYMEARLSGPNFTITAITPEKQAVSRSSITEWKWEIQPNKVGIHYLHLTLSALLSVDNSSMSKTIRTFDKVIEIKVVWYQHVGLFFKEYWQWLWTALLVPIAGWLWKRKKESKPEHNQSDS